MRLRDKYRYLQFGLSYKNNGNSIQRISILINLELIYVTILLKFMNKESNVEQ